MHQCVKTSIKTWNFEGSGEWEILDQRDWPCPPRIGEMVKLKTGRWRVQLVVWEHECECEVLVSREWGEITG